MDKLTAMRVFLAVARLNSFSAAADELDLTRSRVTRAVKFLEQELGVRLLNRSTRHLSLTQEGAAYLHSAQRLLDDLDDMEQHIGTTGWQPRGRLRISAPNTFGASHLPAAISAFMDTFEDVSVELVLNNRLTDLVEEGFDVAVRMGELKSSNLVARRIAESDQVVCAAPAYLKRYGAPEDVAALAEHNCLRYAYQASRSTWRLFRGGREHEVEVRGDFTANAADALREAAIAGRGLILLPRHFLQQAIHAGLLQVVLGDYQPPAIPINVLYLERRFLSAKIRCFVDFLVNYDFSPA